MRLRTHESHPRVKNSTSEIKIVHFKIPELICRLHSGRQAEQLAYRKLKRNGAKISHSWHYIIRRLREELNPRYSPTSKNENQTSSPQVVQYLHRPRECKLFHRFIPEPIDHSLAIRFVEKCCKAANQMSTKRLPIYSVGSYGRIFQSIT